jgi:pyruvate, orthophosphate dikinase
MLGTMIEVPRGAITAGEIAEVAEFFSFGTNDLTQTTLGLSRDDAGRFLPEYVNREIYQVDPFVSVDQSGVGFLMQHAAKSGRETRENIKLGICGEHGGDPESVEFCHRIGLNYVSCSPFRIPIARLAAARAAVKDELARKENKKAKKDKNDKKEIKVKKNKKSDKKKDKKKSKKK